MRYDLVATGYHFKGPIALRRSVSTVLLNINYTSIIFIRTQFVKHFITRTKYVNLFTDVSILIPAVFPTGHSYKSGRLILVYGFFSLFSEAAERSTSEIKRISSEPAADIISPS